MIANTIPYTISKKIVLARAIVKKPKMLILENPLDQFHSDEAERIITFLTKPSQPWSLIVISNNNQWKSNCSKHITMKKGTIINIDKL